MLLVQGLGSSRQWLLQRTMWSSGIASHLLPHLASSLGCLAAPAQNRCFPTPGLTEGQVHVESQCHLETPSDFSLNSAVLDPLNQRARKPPSTQVRRVTYCSLREQRCSWKSVPSSLNPASPFLSWFSVRESKCQAEYSAANRWKDQQNKITRISGSKLTLFCEETCE